MMQLFNTRQGDQESLTAFHKRLESQIEVTESVWGGAIIPATTLSTKKPSNQQTKSRKAFYSRLFLKLLHRRCQPITKQLARDHINGDDNYPDDMTSGLTWVSNQAEAAGISIHPFSVKKNNNNKTKQSSNGGPTAHIEATLNALKNETSFNQVQQGSVL